MTEDLSNTPALDGMVWDVPEFKRGFTKGETLELTIEDQEILEVALTNTLKSLKADFMVSKTVSGDNAADFVTRDFVFDYICDDVDATTGSVTVKGDGVKVAAGVSLPVGTTCTVTETDAANFDPDHFTWTKPAEQTVTIADTSNGTAAAALVFDNNYAQKSGSFQIKKDVEGYKGADQDDFQVQYTCGTAAPVTVALPFNGDAVTVDNIPVGTVCTVTEVADSAARDNHSVATAYSVGGVPTNEITIAGAPDLAQVVTVTNTYTQYTGTFKLAKKVTGDYTPATDESFKVSYKCGTDAAVEVDLPADGTEVAGPVCR